MSALIYLSIYLCRSSLRWSTGDTVYFIPTGLLLTAFTNNDSPSIGLNVSAVACTRLIACGCAGPVAHRVAEPRIGPGSRAPGDADLAETPDVRRLGAREPWNTVKSKRARSQFSKHRRSLGPQAARPVGCAATADTSLELIQSEGNVLLFMTISCGALAGLCEPRCATSVPHIP